MRLLLMLLCCAVLAQDTRLRGESRPVVVPVSVTDRKGRAVHGLETANFEVFDNGVRQNDIADISAADSASIALVVAVQSSGISSAALAQIRKIGPMIQPLILGERGCAAVASFAERTEWQQECTNNPDDIVNALYTIQPGEDKSGRLLDAVNISVERLRRRRNVRRILLLISESRDRGSESGLEEVVAAAQGAGVTIYAITYSAFQTALIAKSSEIGNRPVEKAQGPAGRDPGSPPLPQGAPLPPPSEQRVDILAGLGELVRLGKMNTAEVLTRSTGGVTLAFARRKGLEKAIGKLASDIHSQYLIAFAPEAPLPGYHRIAVRLKPRGNFRIRGRQGYCVAGPSDAGPAQERSVSACIASAASAAR